MGTKEKDDAISHCREGCLNPWTGSASNCRVDRSKSEISNIRDTYNRRLSPVGKSDYYAYRSSLKKI